MELKNIGEVSKMFCISKSKAYKMIANGQLECIRIGNRLRFSEEQITKFIEKNTEMKNDNTANK